MEHVSKKSKFETMELSFGAICKDEGVHFCVWAPQVSTMEVVVFENAEKEKYAKKLQKDESTGIWTGLFKDCKPGDLYKYRFDGKGPFPDPASRFQPFGVHGPSQVMESNAYPWKFKNWGSLSKDNLVLYEIHVGTFAGTFQEMKKKLQHMKELGVDAIEIMPLADFPGKWNWGYDGVCLYAPARCYGHPDDLRDLVDAAHEIGLGVILDVVYNHLGPDGNYLGAYCSYYFTEKHHTPWGAAINFDVELDPTNAPIVRRFFLENAIYWIKEFDVDGFRLDAIHAIQGPPPFIKELNATCKKVKDVILIGEDDRNLNLLIEDTGEGYGLDGLWADDFHHQLRVMLAGDHESYFQDFDGKVSDLAKTIQQGWFYVGQKSINAGCNRGTDPLSIPRLSKFCVCIQNHDQIGNRALGERLHHQISLQEYKAASAVMILIPHTCLLFMGQEWATSSPFLYFTDHKPDLGKLVTEGRRKEFAKFSSFSDPKIRETIPDPQAEATFQKSKVKWDELEKKPHKTVFEYYKALLAIRKHHPAFQTSERVYLQTQAVSDKTIAITRRSPNSKDKMVVCVINLLGKESISLSQISSLETILEKSKIKILLNSEDDAFKTEESITPPKLENQTLHFFCPGAVVLEASLELITK